jgi:enamine deaminase RidA (YjgF/YER057c/UK114 family)
MSKSESSPIVPEGWQRAHGYSHGVVAEGARRLVYIAGQVAGRGGDTQSVVSDDFVAQWDQVLANMKAVVEAAGGTVEDIVAVRVFVTDVDEYLANSAATAEPHRRHFGRHFPAATLVGVTGLVTPGAKIEMEGTAIIR